MFNRKWKPNKKQLAEWLAKKDEIEENFKNEINEIEKASDTIITINKNCNSIYFEKDGIEYRISTHYKSNSNYSNFNTNLDDSLNIKGGKRENIVTNSRDNIIKWAKKILIKSE